MTDPLHVVLDASAMVAVGRGNALASRLIVRAHSENDFHIYAPVCALVEADRARPGTFEHVAGLPGVTFLELDLPAALALTREKTWAAAHTRHAVEPALDRPDGALLATAAPREWANQPVRILDLGS